MSTKQFRTLDVRPTLKAGGEPFGIITNTVASLKPDEGLILITPFLPSPLIECLQSEGFCARPERLTDGSWQTAFTIQSTQVKPMDHTISPQCPKRPVRTH